MANESMPGVKDNRTPEVKKLRGLRYARMLGRRNIFEQSFLTAAVQNMKRIAKIHPHASGVAGKIWHAQKKAQYQIHLAVDAHGMPVRFLITEDTAVDCTQTCAQIEEIPAEYLLADCGYDCNKTIKKALAAGMQVVISPRKSQKEPQRST